MKFKFIPYILFCFTIVATPFWPFLTKVYAYSPPDPRFGVDAATFSTPQSGDLSPVSGPVNGNDRINKHAYLVRDFLSPQNTSTWAWREMNGSNKIQYIQSSTAFYVPKSMVKNYQTQPGWITAADIANLGFTNWSQVPTNYPVWDPAGAIWDEATGGYYKTGYPAGTLYFQGWKDTAGRCIPPGQTSSFLDLTTNTVRTLRVLGGINGDAIAAPTVSQITLCNWAIHDEEGLKNFIRRHQNSRMTYIIFNETRRYGLLNSDSLLPDQYAESYNYYLNLIKGQPGCIGGGITVLASTGLDTNAQVVVANPAIVYMNEAYTWYNELYNVWIARVNNATCTPYGPYKVIPRNNIKLLPTDGIPYYVYADEPLTMTDVCPKFTAWRDKVTSNTQRLTTDYLNKFSDTTPLLNEFGIYRSQQNLQNPNISNLLPNSSITSLMVQWISRVGFSTYNIKFANWLITYNYMNWKQTQGTVPLADLYCHVFPTDPTCSSGDGRQIFFINADESNPRFATKVFESFYRSIRGDYSMIDPSLTCALPAASATSSPTRLPLGPSSKPDPNTDGVMNEADYNYVVSVFGTADPKADFNKNGIVDIYDFALLF